MKSPTQLVLKRQHIQEGKSYPEGTPIDDLPADVVQVVSRIGNVMSVEVDAEVENDANKDSDKDDTDKEAKKAKESKPEQIAPKPKQKRKAKVTK